MLFQFVALVISSDCDLLYTSDGCGVCVSHYGDRQCGWCGASQKCVSVGDNEKCDSKLYYGPNQKCDADPAPTPTPEPTTEPVPALDDQCGFYSDCEECTIHWTDRKCGWCGSSAKCIQYNANGTDCPDDQLYYNNNAKCGAVITPVPTPWPRYYADPGFCSSMTGSWCKKCVSKNTSMSCGWCGETKECVMGDAFGPLFGTCDSWSYSEDRKCTGKMTKKSILAVRLTVAIAISIIAVAGIVLCIKSFRASNEENNIDDNEYMAIPEQ